jgi:stage II sporulation protein AA (anti-sigma F factor antagonist)
MELKKISDSDIQITLQIDGTLDADSCKQVQPVIDELIWIDTHTSIALDFRHVEFLDSSGVGAIVYLYKRLNEKQRNMRINNASGQPLEIINLLRIGKTIPVNA